MERDYLIAGLRVRMDVGGKTERQAKPYRAEQTVGQVDIEINQFVMPQDESVKHLTEEQVEYIWTGADFYRKLIVHNGLMLHASAVVVDGYAYLFSAPSGTGKSTHTNLWLKKFGDAAYILNDDKPALRKEDGRWYAYGTPWSGKTDLNVNRRVPLGGICMLYRGAHNEIEPFTGTAAIHALLEQTLRPKSVLRMQILELLDDLMSQVPVWKLSCTPEIEAVEVSYQAMSEAAKNI